MSSAMPSILVIGDAHRSRLEHVLGSGYHLVFSSFSAASGSSGHAAILVTAPGGADELQQIEAGRGPWTPILVLGEREECADPPLEGIFYIDPSVSDGELLARVEARIEIAGVRARAESEIAESQRRLQTLVSNLPGMAYRCRNDDDLTMEFISEGVLAVTGYTAEDLVRKRVRWSDLWHPADVDWTGAIVSRAVRSGKAFQFEYRIIHRDGSVRWVWEQGQPIFEREGDDNPVAFEGFVTDITKRKTAEERMSKLASDLSLITDNVPALISYVDSAGRYRYTNRTYLEWFGLTPGEVEGRHIRDVLGDPAWEAIRGHAEAALAGRRVSYGNEIPYHGGTRYIHADYVPDIQPDGTVAGFFALVNDMTSHRAAEHALRESEARFREMADNAPVMTWVVDEQGSCTFLNRLWYEFTGQTPETGLGFGWLAAVHPDDAPRAEKIFAAAVESRSPFQIEYRLRRADGSYRWAIDAAAPRLGKNGEFLGYIGSVIDITDRKAAEDALRASARALREADRLKDEFLATLSHELRTPMTSILGWAQMIGSGSGASDEIKVACEAILRSARAQKQLVEDVLDISRMTTGRMRLERRPSRLDEVIAAALDTIRPAAEAKRIELGISFDREMPALILDPDRMQQVIWNLLSNAVKFHPGGGRVEVRLSRSEGEAVIEVADDGPGIDPDVLPHVFERFRQADSSSRRSHGGLGLGLALAKELTELHGGRIEARSELGAGATFSLRLPLLEEADAPSALIPDETPEDRRMLTGLNVLLVDDDPDSLLMFGTALRREGASVRSAESVDRAIESYREWRPDIVLSDIAMPNRDGYDLLESIRSIDDRVPVVALTAHERGVSDRPSRFAFDEYLIKPLEVHEVIDMIRRTVSRR